jgi:hypothetical protein
MKTKQIFAVLTILSTLLFASVGHAAFVTATNSGNWSDTNIWDSGTLPAATNDVFIAAGVNVTVDITNAMAFTIGDDTIGVAGAVTMAPNSTLNIYGNFGTDQLTLLDATATGNTVIYWDNPFFAKECNYFNLVFCNTNYAVSNMSYQSNYQNFNNFSRNGPTPMNIAGDMTVLGNIRVQQGADMSIGGNLILGQYCGWDSSVANLTVMGNTVMGGFLMDLDSANGTNGFYGNMTVTATSFFWYVSDVTTWFLNGNLTNNGTILGTGYGSIIFNGTGIITGSKAITIPTMTVNGTYTIGTTITLTTNTPTLNGTLVFDLARTNQIVLRYSPSGTNAQTTQTNYYSGNLVVINSGVPPVSGNSYKFFTASNYAGAFTSTTFPSLPAGLSWVDNLAASGSIAVTGGTAGFPIITMSRSGAVLTLSWNSTTFPGYQVLALTNHSVKGTPWSSTGSGTVSPFITTINPANPSVFYRLSNP